MESTIVIKVKLGETLRRFNASIIGEELDLDFNELREKIISLFSLPSDSELTLTYLDEDGDVVTLADENDLDDVVRQLLNPLRISVTLHKEQSIKSQGRSSGSSTPMRSPKVQPSLQNLDGSVSEILKSVPEAILEKLSKLSTEVGSNTTRSPPVHSEILESLSKIGLYYLKEVAGTVSGPSVKTTDTQVNKEDNNIKVDETKQVPKSEGDKKGVSDTLTTVADVVNLNAATHGGKLPVGFSSINPSSSSLGVAGLSSKDNGSTSAQKLKEKEDSNESHMGFQTLASSLLAQNFISATKDAAVDFGNSFAECPFLGLPVDNSSPFMYGRPYGPRTVPFKKSHNHNDGSGGSIFHRGVRCDGCGVHPITGPRFKSKVKEDYDLCSICFRDSGNDSDYIRLDRPVSYRHPFSLKGLCKPPGLYYPKLPPQVSRGFSNRSKLNCRFIQDVTIGDGTIMAPSTPFTKIWRMKNNGNVVWPSGSQLVWIGGDMLSKILTAELEIPANGCPVGTEIDIAVDFIAPEHPGRYLSYWRMSSPSGQKFGQRVWVLIQVEAVNEFSAKNVHGFNLNLPPNVGMMDSERENSAPELVNSLPKTDNSGSVPELVEPMTDYPSNPEQELNFPINDNLLVGGTVSNPAPFPLLASSPVASATLSEVVAPNATSPVQTFYTDVDANEQTLLKELELMGFKQIDLNKEILRRNAYDLEQSVDDLCDVPEELANEMPRMDEDNLEKETLRKNETNLEQSADNLSGISDDWDTILVELREMGFTDKEKNKIFLEKNNGSIKRTVMDLIAGEYKRS